jgi:hypothetical protein
MKHLVFLVVALLCCVSCSKGVKKKLGLATFGPNEYAVKKYPKLKIPNEFSLPSVEQSDDKVLKHKTK